MVALEHPLTGAVAGCLVRSLGGIGAAMAGTAMIGVFLTIGNVVVPIIIRRAPGWRHMSSHGLSGRPIMVRAMSPPMEWAMMRTG